MENCCVCFSGNITILKITETTVKNTISIKNQLESLVPEVTWLEDYAICPKCQDTLSLIQEFRQQCLESQKLREMEIKVEEPEIEDYTDIPSPVDPLNTDKLLLGDPLDLEEVNRARQLAKTCSHCGRMFKTKADLHVHEKTHLNLREYECKMCDKKYNTHRNLHTHKLVKHSDPTKWRFHCELCDKRFPMKSHYDFHIKRHNNIKDFKCDLCEKRFKDKYSVRMHLVAHSNVKEFKCDLCGVEYKVKKSLDLHRFKEHQIGNVRVPSTEKNYFCEICGKAFLTNFKLKIHRRTHTGEKPFECNLCDKKFNDKRLIKPHLKRVHNQSEEDEFK